jgi:hypothetical protein
MVCPHCGEQTYRSRSRNFRESLIKRVTPFRQYRCHECGWRGMAGSIKLPRINQKVVYIWVAGVLIAIAIGMFGSSILSDPGPRKPTSPSVNSGR